MTDQSIEPIASAEPEPTRVPVLTATYSAEDNKLRIYSLHRLDDETYARVRAAGFIFAPKQDLFVAPAWTPQREDLIVDLCGEIDDEDIALAERATMRAERFDLYSEKRESEAESARAYVDRIADGIPMGQPILVGHHSERHARRDAKRIENGMRKAVSLWETSEYWEGRAERVMRHAAYKANPRVRANRIAKLESERRGHHRDIAKLQARADAWLTVASIEDPEAQLARAVEIANDDYSWDRRGKLQDGSLPPAQAAAEAIASCARAEANAKRWIAHLDNRLAYERVLLGRRPDEEIKVDRTRKGDAKLPLLNYKQERVETRCRWRKGETESLRQIEMPAAKYARIYKESKGTRVSADGTHRVRIAILHSSGGGFGGEWVVVFISDSKSHPVPTPNPKAPEPTAEEVEAEIAAEEEARVVDEGLPFGAEHVDDLSLPFCACGKVSSQCDGSRAACPRYKPPPVNPFEAMKASLKAGVQAVSVPELFVTPAPLAERVADEADISAGDVVLEPSAGLGALALAARARGATVVCVERAPALASRLRNAYGDHFAVYESDFLDLRPEDLGLFDRVVMNPPFSAEIDHVMHAWSFLKPGGRLVAIMSASVRFGRGVTQVFRAFVAAHGGAIDPLPEGSFTSSGTGVSTVLVVLDKEAAAGPAAT